MGTTPQKKSFLSGLLGPFTGMETLLAEKARLEAFLSAVPGEYCGWAPDGSVAYSDGFCNLLGLETVKSIHDIQARLATADAAALEGLYIKLEEERRPFSLIVSAQDGGRTFRVSGSKGQALDGRDSFDVLWIEDISAAHGERVRLETLRNAAEKEISHLQAALDSLDIPLWMRGGGQDLTWCNKAYALAVGKSPAAVVAEQAELSTTARKGKDKVPGPGMAKESLDSGRPQDTEVHMIICGDRRLMHVIEMPLPSSHRTLGMALDMTREEELENRLSRYVSANKELLEQLGTAIVIYGPDLALEFFNSAFSQLWGLEDQWLNTRPKLGDVLESLRERRRLPEQADFRKFKDSWLRMVTDLIGPHEDMLYLPDGKALRMLVVPHPMGGLMMTFEDVSSRLELESSYNTLIAVQKETLDNLAEGVAVFGGDGRLKLWNPAFGRLWNFNPEDLDGQPHINMLADKMKKFFGESRQTSRRQELVFLALNRAIQDGRFDRNDGTQLHFASMPLPDGGVLISFSDVTDSLRVENALREKNAALETAERVKLDFLANVSYQLRTPLNAILGFSEILGHQYFGPLNERQKEYTSGIQEAGSRLVQLIDDILDLSTIEAGYLELNIQEFNIHSTLESLHDLTQEWARKHKLSIRLDCPKEAGTLHADERRVKQILLNLIRNAIHHTPEGGTITLRGKRLTDYIELSVTDTGVGIPEDLQKKIFEPFERGKGNAERGAGLGLSLVKNIAELHGGSVKLISEEKQGTSVTIILPLKAPAKKKAA